VQREVLIEDEIPAKYKLLKLGEDLNVCLSIHLAVAVASIRLTSPREVIANDGEDIKLLDAIVKILLLTFLCMVLWSSAFVVLHNLW
jgi:hypothetical protein